MTQLMRPRYGVFVEGNFSPSMTTNDLTEARVYQSQVAGFLKNQFPHRQVVVHEWEDWGTETYDE